MYQENVMALARKPVIHRSRADTAFPLTTDTKSGAPQDTLGEGIKFSRKEIGAYYTPEAVAASLVMWAVRHSSDRMLDPACGDGRFIAQHQNSVGIEQDIRVTRQAKERAPGAFVYERNFFEWASETTERFDCAVGNPPFIRYQTFKGRTRELALSLCASLGIRFSGLTSSWAPFLVVAASRLHIGGRIAFVVPAEIGHAPYATRTLDYLTDNFATVHVIAIRKKLFPELSEDCWLLFAEGFGARTDQIKFTALDSFSPMSRPPHAGLNIPVIEWRESWNRRLRSFLMPSAARDLYREIANRPGTKRFGDLTSIGIGYVSGANQFFHLRPSAADALKIPTKFLHPTVRNGRVLPQFSLTSETVKSWWRADNSILLLRIPKTELYLPQSVWSYLDTDEGRRVRKGYKCRNRDPWYSVPDVQVPDFFLTYMSGRAASLVRNDAGCTCTNSLHSVRLKHPMGLARLMQAWNRPITRLSCEVEGHPLGGGLLKLEPREASAIVLPAVAADPEIEYAIVGDAIKVMQSWRHYS
jgi:adenine-specific DNA-methyltransferase